MWRLALLSATGCNVVFPIGTPGPDAANDAMPALDTSVVPDTRPTSTLIAHFPLDELTNNTTADLSEYQHPAECLLGTCPMPIPDGTHASAFRFVGGQFLRVVEPGTSYDLPAFTIAAWVRPASAVGARHTLFALPLKNTTDANSAWAVVATENVLEFDTAHMDGSPHLIEASFTVGVWQHVAATWDGQVKQLAIDGVVMNSESVTSPFIPGPAAAAAIGADIDGTPSLFFQGDLDDIQLYSYALTDTELRELAQP